MTDRLPHYQDAIADSYGPALEGEQLEAWMRAQEDLALQRELEIERRASINRDALYREGLELLQGIQPPYGIVPSPAPMTMVHVTKRMTMRELEPRTWPVIERARPFRTAARVLAERMTADIELLEQWRTIESLALQEGVDYERPAFLHRRRSIPTQGPASPRGIFFNFGPRPITKAEQREHDDRELWLEHCKRRLEGALTRHALLGDALATIHQAWQHDGPVVLEHVRDELEAW